MSSPLSETSAFTVTNTPEEKESSDISSSFRPIVNVDEKIIAAKPSKTSQEPIPSIQESELPTNTPNVRADKEGELSPAEKKKLVEALKTMSSDSALSDVKQTLDELKENRQDFKEVILYIQ